MGAIRASMVWTLVCGPRAVVTELIQKKFGIGLGLTAVGELLAGLGLTPQEAAATGLSTRSRSHREVATGNLSGHCRASQGARG